jgi:hypothetical protein
MAYDFEGSKAQTNLSFTINETISSVVGQNYWTPVIYIGSANAATNIVSPSSTYPNNFYVSLGNYQSLLLGDLLDWFTSYFSINGITHAYIVTYDSTVASYGGLTTAFNATKTLGYFKFIYESASAAQIALGALCNGDSLTSRFWAGTNDTGVLVNPMTSGIGFDLAEAGIEAFGVYSIQSGINPALSQLALTLSTLNASGVSVGNRVESLGTTLLQTSAATSSSDYTNLTALQQQAIEANNWGFFQTTGNSTGQVSLNGSLSTKGNDEAAKWFESYQNYLGQVYGAQYFNQNPNTAFKDNISYQVILSMLRANLQPFVTARRITNLTITSTPFSKLPSTSGNNITIPNAWSADFIRGIETATVQGNLSITI